MQASANPSFKTTRSRRRVAVIQPYFFPYVGYFELLARADVVCWLDDVQFPRRGWVHRNRVRSDARASDWTYLTLPVQKAPQKTAINRMRVTFTQDWLSRVRSMLVCGFGNASLEHPVLAPLWSCADRAEVALTEVLDSTLQASLTQLGLSPEQCRASELSVPPQASAQARIVALVKAIGGDHYINLPGGRALYDPAYFAEAGLKLSFLPMTSYHGPSGEHAATWSILDGLLSGEQAPLREHLARTGQQSLASEPTAAW